MAGGDERSEKLMTVEEATLEELDVQDYGPDNHIVEACRLDDGLQLWYVCIPYSFLPCICFGPRLI